MTERVPTLEDLPPLEGKRVLLRADFNVPLRDGEITDDLRIRAALPTIGWLQDHGATVVACTHLGRPKGKPDPKYSVAPVRARFDDAVSLLHCEAVAVVEEVVARLNCSKQSLTEACENAAACLRILGDESNAIARGEITPRRGEIESDGNVVYAQFGRR